MCHTHTRHTHDTHTTDIRDTHTCHIHVLHTRHTHDTHTRHLHKLPSMHSSSSAAVGVGWFLRNVYRAMTMPGVQKPHWDPCSFAMRSAGTRKYTGNTHKQITEYVQGGLQRAACCVCGHCHHGKGAGGGQCHFTPLLGLWVGRRSTDPRHWPGTATTPPSPTFTLPHKTHPQIPRATAGRRQ
jgi:hypothetical protein